MMDLHNFQIQSQIFFKQGIIICLVFTFWPRECLIESKKIKLKNLKFGMVVANPE